MRCQWRQVSAQRLLRTRSTFSKSVMVSVAVSSLGFTDLIFIEPGVKINGEYYRNVLLSQHLLPLIRNISGSECFTFQQDNAPAHRARETVEFLSLNTPDFIAPSLWPPNSPSSVYSTIKGSTNHLALTSILSSKKIFWLCLCVIDFELSRRRQTALGLCICIIYAL